MGIGTDVVEHYMELYPGIYLTEMKYFIELGASPMETIVAATKRGALVLGLASWIQVSNISEPPVILFLECNQ